MKTLMFLTFLALLTSCQSAPMTPEQNQCSMECSSYDMRGVVSEDGECSCRRIYHMKERI